ncbi:MAG: efflux transporter periplasmic adaptor subunit [Flavobacteriaceae bacterium]|nr:efflux transporter periplasmic adaptor subunit [Flavobacteriaceae bacterium]
MDKKIKKKYWTLKRIISYSVGSLIILTTLYFLFFGGSNSSVEIDKDKVTVSEVRTGIFQEYIPQTGTVEPKYTFYLDAVEGGVIKKVHKESGSILKPGDVILELSNLNRELNVLSQEASLNESINRVRQTRLSLEQNDLQQLQTLAEIDNQIQKLEPQYNRNKQLFEKKLISKQEFEQIEADYFYNLKRRDITYRSYKKDSLSRKRQLVQLNQSEQRMSQSLDGVGKILDNLVVKSPIEGQLSAPNLFEGQSISPGERLGQVDVVGTYKIKSRIDELYLPKIDTGLKATTTINGEVYELKITYIYPTITEGRFEVDLEFTNKIPEGIKRGQTLRLRIELGDSTDETLINSGAFYNKTGGNWIYVLNEDGTKATKRNISLGRENSEAYVVISGLEPGEKVITSSYDNFGDNDIIKFK